RWLAEHLALRALARGAWADAENVRATAAADGVDAQRIAWKALDAGDSLNDPNLLSDVPTGAVRAWMSRELGIPEGYPGAEERQVLRLIHNGGISVGELIQPADNWIEEHL